MAGQEATDHSNVRLEHGHDEITVEVSGGDHVFDGLLELVNTTE
jgi:hypothetical protein